MVRSDSSNHSVSDSAATGQVKTVLAEIEGGGWHWWYVCSECHGTIDQKDKICPHCKGVIRWE